MYGFLFGVFNDLLSLHRFALHLSHFVALLSQGSVFLPEAVVLVIYIAWSNIPVTVFFFLFVTT